MQKKNTFFHYLKVKKFFPTHFCVRANECENKLPLRGKRLFEKSNTRLLNSRALQRFD